MQHASPAPALTMMATQNVPPPAYQDSPQVSDWRAAGWGAAGPEAFPGRGRARPPSALPLPSLGASLPRLPERSLALGKAPGQLSPASRTRHPKVQHLLMAQCPSPPRFPLRAQIRQMHPAPHSGRPSSRYIESVFECLGKPLNRGSLYQIPHSLVSACLWEESPFSPGLHSASIQKRARTVSQHPPILSSSSQCP